MCTADGQGPLQSIKLFDVIRLQTRAPPALLRLVGRQAYASGVQDVFDMLQSPTFVLQVGVSC